jgi:hypothetical protein
MVEVFKTDIRELGISEIVLRKLHEHFPKYEVNFDLEDCDRILRVEGNNVRPGEVIRILTDNGYYCEVLE